MVLVLTSKTSAPPAVLKEERTGAYWELEGKQSPHYGNTERTVSLLRTEQYLICEPIRSNFCKAITHVLTCHSNLTDGLDPSFVMICKHVHFMSLIVF